jgi:hypothetical protein
VRTAKTGKATLINFVGLAHTVLKKSSATLLENLAIILESRAPLLFLFLPAKHARQPPQ